MLNFSEANIDSRGTTNRSEPEVYFRLPMVVPLLSIYAARNCSVSSYRDSPKTWETLLEVMRDAHLGELAK